MQRNNKVAVIGSGNFGTCLAQTLTTTGHHVTLWSRNKDVVESINSTHKNPLYLSSIELSPNIKATNDLNDPSIMDSTAIVIAIPTQYLRNTLLNFNPEMFRDKLIVSAVKGMEISTGKMPDQIIEEIFGENIKDNIVVLSGPSFAIEVAQKQPTNVTMASTNEQRAKEAQQLFHTPFFRAYTSDDPLGVEIAGALKNIIAIASGASSGLGFQANTRAGIITRGLAEITKAGVAMGANPLTFLGNAGVGDLFLTCSSEKSRNFTVGYRLGKGESIKSIIDSMGEVAEGVSTAKAAYALSQKLNIDMPIIKVVYEVLYNEKPIKDAVSELLNREAKKEIS